MEKRDEDFETRLHDLESWRERKTGGEQRECRIGAGADALGGSSGTSRR